MAEVTSTRTSWDDFRSQHKKEARFREFGRDDREREKAFKAWLKELGEVKRADAKRLEAKFVELLKERCTDLSADSSWSDVRRELVDDPRFVAVKSSSTKEDLFNKYLATLATTQANEQDDAERKAREKKERAVASLREREEQVRLQKQKLDQDANRSRAEADRGSDEREFGQLLIDAVRSYEVRLSHQAANLVALLSQSRTGTLGRRPEADSTRSESQFTFPYTSSQTQPLQPAHSQPQLQAASLAREPL